MRDTAISAGDYLQRTYRGLVRTDLVAFQAAIGESDLLICAKEALVEPAEAALRECRSHLERYLEQHPDFHHSLQPVDASADAPHIVLTMAEAARAAGVGPMAAVAGAVAEQVGRALLDRSPEVVVENGGDIYSKSAQPRVAAIFAGKSPLSSRVGVRLPAGEWGLCTSSGTVGPSLSFGRADAAVVLSPSAPLADAAATALGNLVKSPEEIGPALDRIIAIPGIAGCVVIIGDRLGAKGRVELVPVSLDYLDVSPLECGGLPPL